MANISGKHFTLQMPPEGCMTTGGIHCKYAVLLSFRRQEKSAILANPEEATSPCRCFNEVFFKNTEGIQLSGRLDLPADQKPHNFAIFAHCFTCNKNFHAAAMSVVRLRSEDLVFCNSISPVWAKVKAIFQKVAFPEI